MVSKTSTILTVMAHPDDAELWAGGTIARHTRVGGAAVIAIAKGDPVRVAEAEAGAGVLGAHLYLVNDLSTDAISTLLAEVRPEVVITHASDDIHPDHRRCAEYLASALPDVVIATGHPSRVYQCDSYNNLDRHGRPLDLPTIIDITEHWNAKTTALHAHASQPIITHFGPMAETLAHLHGRRIGTRYGEAFRALPVLGLQPAATEL